MYSPAVIPWLSQVIYSAHIILSTGAGCPPSLSLFQLIREEIRNFEMFTGQYSFPFCKYGMALLS